MTGAIPCRTSIRWPCRSLSRRTRSGSCTNIKHVPADCRKIENLKGSFRIVLLQQTDPLEVPNILSIHNALRSRRLDRADQGTGQGAGDLQAALTLFRNGLSTQDWREQRESQGFSLRDDKGRLLTRGAFNAEENGDQVDYELTFFKSDPSGQLPGGAGEPATLIMQLPLEPARSRCRSSLRSWRFRSRRSDGVLFQDELPGLAS